MDKYIKGGMRMLRYAVMLLIMFCRGTEVCAGEETAVTGPVLNSGNTAWLLVASILGLFMSIPGIALFYGGPG